MDVAEIIQAVEKLSPVDRAKVADALARSDDSTQPHIIAERQADFHRRLIDKGLLKSVPDLASRDRKFKPIKIKGKPLSETIIEERR